ncbi:MAG: AI-2E family transporter [Actinomycetota bacterium]
MDVGDESSEPARTYGSIAGEGPRASPPSPPRTDYRWMMWLIVIAPLAAVAIVATLNFLSAIAGILRVILFSQFIALALEPGVNWLARRGWRRGVATGALMGGLAIVGIVVLLSIIPRLISELAGLLAELPKALADLGSRLGLDISVTRIEEVLQDQRADLAALAADLAGNALELTAAFLGTLGNISVIALLSFYLTAEAPKLRRTLLAFLPRKQQLEVLRLWEISTDKVGGYLYSRALMGLISGLASYAVLRLLGVPFAAPLSIFVGFVSQFVPVVGTYIAYALPVLIALATGGLRPAVILVVFATLYQQLENLLISPRLSARTMQLHPAVAFVAAMMGGALGGVSAAFLALPVAAIFQAFGSTFLTRYEVVESALTQEQPISTAADPSREEKEPLLKRVWLSISKSSSE